MITLILTFITKWKWVLIASGCILCFCGGFYLRGLIYTSNEVKALKETLSIEHKSNNDQFDHDLKAAKGQAIIQQMNDKLNQDIDSVIIKTPIPNCNITADRMLLINRAASRK